MTAAAATTLPTGTLPTSTCVGAESAARRRRSRPGSRTPRPCCRRRRPRAPTRGRRPASGGSGPAPRSPRRPAVSRSRSPIATWSSTADQNGTSWGTVPMNATANGMLVSSDTTSASTSQPHVACCSVCHSSAGSPMRSRMMTDGREPAEPHDRRADPGARGLRSCSGSSSATGASLACDARPPLRRARCATERSRFARENDRRPPYDDGRVRRARPSCTSRRRRRRRDRGCAGAPARRRRPGGRRRCRAAAT